MTPILCTPILCVLIGGAAFVICIGIALAVSMERSIRYDRAHDAYQREREEGD